MNQGHCLVEKKDWVRNAFC